MVCIAGILAVINPEFFNQCAYLIGIGRGTDLLLYCFMMCFIFLAIDAHFKYADLYDKVVTLARRNTIMEKKLQDMNVQV